jgi:glycosyltransferase involved in cell wall biosynthesis
VNQLTGTNERLTVVVAAQDAAATLPRCLDALRSQRADAIGQIIVVDGSRTPDAIAAAVAEHTGVEFVEHGPGLVPELWAAGILRSREAIVALTTANMAAEPGWADSLLDVYARETYDAVGGIILPGADLDRSAAAVYWLRYHRYAGRLPAGPVDDIPGDNGSYRRGVLEPAFSRIRREGFWEFEFNQELRRRGGRLYSTPAAAVRYLGGESFGDFARQRVVHGRRFGGKRVAAAPGPRRWLSVAVWPLTPVAFLVRIVREARRAGGSASLARSFGPLIWLLLCWSIGELEGYVLGA